MLVGGCGGAEHSSVPPAPNAAPTHGDWPVFGGDQDATFSAPQTQINAGTISRLGLAWSSGLGPHQYLEEDYPSEIGGKLYVTTSSDEIQAYDARSGRRIWQYTPQVDFAQSTGVEGDGVSTNRGVAVSDGRLFLLTFDDRLQAVDASTGEEEWSSSVADASSGAYEAMAPSVYDGEVIVGVSGSGDGTRGFVAAYSQRSGAELWRFYTVPPSGTGSVSSSGGGGAVDMTPTVDPRTGLVYAGTGTPAPASAGPRCTGAHLETDTIIALNARTGKLVWREQESPRDVGSDGAASPVMVVGAGPGARTPAVAEAGDGRVWILDARTGRLLFTPAPYVGVHHPVRTIQGTVACAGVSGGSPSSPMALDPQVDAVYVSGVTGGRTGTFDAVDLATGRFLWRRAMATPMIGGAVATAGNLVFTGDQRGVLYAVNARTGRTEWEGHLGLAFGSAPIVYTLHGVEYLAAVLGGSASTAAWHLGPIGARIVVLKLGARTLSPDVGVLRPGTARTGRTRRPISKVSQTQAASFPGGYELASHGTGVIASTIRIGLNPQGNLEGTISVTEYAGGQPSSFVVALADPRRRGARVVMDLRAPGLGSGRLGRLTLRRSAGTLTGTLKLGSRTSPVSYKPVASRAAAAAKHAQDQSAGIFSAAVSGAAAISG